MRIFIPIIPLEKFFNKTGGEMLFDKDDFKEIFFTHLSAKMISKEVARGEKFVFVSDDSIVALQITGIIEKRFQGFKSKVVGETFILNNQHSLSDSEYFVGLKKRLLDFLKESNANIIFCMDHSKVKYFTSFLRNGHTEYQYHGTDTAFVEVFDESMDFYCINSDIYSHNHGGDVFTGEYLCCFGSSNVTFIEKFMMITLTTGCLDVMKCHFLAQLAITKPKAVIPFFNCETKKLITT